MRLCSHVITNDTGLAPNPFHDYCTSAVCTPSHMRAKLQKGDWLIGNSSGKDGNCLVYAMHISQVLDMNTYFHDGRFERKKPKPKGTLTEQCGDNLYYRQGPGEWRRLQSSFHNESASFVRDVGKDLAGRPVFISEHFYYFGGRRLAIPSELAGVIWNRQGIHYTTGRLAGDFVTWLEANHTPGLQGRSRDMVDHAAEMGPMITSLIVDNGVAKSQESLSNVPHRSRGCR
jgi:hypothetical protein